MTQADTIRTNLFLICREKGISYGELKRRTGMSTNAITNYRKGGNTTVKSLELMADAAGVSIMRLCRKVNT